MRQKLEQANVVGLCVRQKEVRVILGRVYFIFGSRLLRGLRFRSPCEGQEEVRVILGRVYFILGSRLLRGVRFRSPCEGYS
jgi:hypothetical protein